MAIDVLLQSSSFEPAEIEAMAEAFDAARDKLQLANRDGAFGQLVARRVVDHARAGIKNPQKICELVVSEFKQFARDASKPTAA